MVRRAIEKARELQQRYPGLTFPIDMEYMSQAEGCILIDWPFLNPVREVKRGNWIGLAEGLNVRDRRYLIAHALAHHLLHAGNQLSFCDWRKVGVLKQEREADECAAHILLPEHELSKIRWMRLWELAEYFGVPENLVRRRLTEFATVEERRRRSSIVEP